MRLVIVNPQVHHYARILRNFLLHNKDYYKYPFVPDCYMKNKPREVAILIDGTRSSFNELGIHFRFFSIFFSYIEFIFWCLLNKFNPFSFKVYFDVKKLNPKQDVIFTFSFTTLDSFVGNNNEKPLTKFEGLVFIHLTHYLRNTQQISENVEKIKNKTLVAENNLVNNSYFQHFFPKEKEVYHLPFCFQDRFVPTKPFNERINKCLAIGTCSSLGAEYEKFFGKNQSFHPMRKTILDHSQELIPYIDSLISDYDKTRMLNRVENDDSLSKRWFKKHLPYFLLTKVIPNHLNQYYNFNIVEKYNDYKMFISSEEIFGLPSINAFEGMACGSALIAIEDPMYTNLGLKPGKHYISYRKNDLGDLVKVIKYYQNNPKELELIASGGQDFVREHFSKKAVADKFWEDMKFMSNKFKNGNHLIRCSFNT